MGREKVYPYYLDDLTWVYEEDSLMRKLKVNINIQCLDHLIMCLKVFLLLNTY